MFETALFLVAVTAGAVAGVAGFAIGSLLTPMFALLVGTKTAVAAVSLPHFVGTAVRWWLLRSNVDRPLLWRFGITSAAGGLTGALLHESASSQTLAMIFGALLVFAGASQMTGYAERWRLHGAVAWVAGAISGFFGGLVGNQGGIRSAAMLEFDVTKDRFVATATAVALLVDVARVPVYLVVEGKQVMALAPYVLTATIGVILGTFAARPLLARVPERRFRFVVGTTIFLLGLFILIRRQA
jgi:uncharacterized membrane protein YfcA